MGSLPARLAARYIRRHPERRSVSLASLVSVAGVALGAGALIVVMSVLSGLEGFIARSVTSAGAPLEVVPSSGAPLLGAEALSSLLSALPSVESVEQFVEGEAILRIPSRDIETACRMRGVPPGGGFARSLDGSLVYGTLDLRAGDGFPGLVTGLYLAEDLYHPLGDTILILPPRSFFGSSGFTVGRAVLTGAVETGLPANDRSLAFIPIDLAGRLFLPSGGCTGLSVGVAAGADPRETASGIRGILPESLEVTTWQDRNRSLAASMQLERAGSFAAILLISLVAAFNIAGTISRSVVERRRDIAILRAMGAGRSLVLGVFMLEGLIVGGLGMVLGLAGGLAGAWLVGSTGVFTLPDVYSFHDRIPVEVDPLMVAAVCLSSITLSVAASLLPAMRAASSDPVGALRS